MKLLRDLLPLEGDVLLRRPVIADVPALCEIEYDDDVKAFSKKPEGDRSAWMQATSRKIDEWESAVVARRHDTAVLGRASLARELYRPDGSTQYAPPFRYDLQVFIGRPYWGEHCGDATARLLISTAFDKLQAHAVTATVNPLNIHAKRLLCALGFEFEATAGEFCPAWQRGHEIYVCRQAV